MQNIDSEPSGSLAFLLSVDLDVGIMVVDFSQQQLDSLTTRLWHRWWSAVGQRCCSSSVGPVETAAEPSWPDGAVWGSMSGVTTRENIEQKHVEKQRYRRLCFSTDRSRVSFLSQEDSLFQDIATPSTSHTKWCELRHLLIIQHCEIPHSRTPLMLRQSTKQQIQQNFNIQFQSERWVRGTSSRCRRTPGFKIPSEEGHPDPLRSASETWSLFTRHTSPRRVFDSRHNCEFFDAMVKIESLQAKESLHLVECKNYDNKWNFTKINILLFFVTQRV